MGYLYFCWPWARTSAWYLVLQVSSGYKMVVLNRDPMAPEVASDRDSRSRAISNVQYSTIFEIKKYTQQCMFTFVERERVGVIGGRARSKSKGGSLFLGTGKHLIFILFY